ncbi:hypothetical protein K461DRAFT_283274 [Myriangium duriaei CBS 260.36]|uniref:Uncharacterized protein n=1 Tax=Myriangium duriaei CBS 260.36 TaxID=1168546 RepID=A0A9P4IVU9_9PEZI|nr:hypothetical protein K461DRAFT_283274 [Myriangium duriaei CBS 260.36]
MPLTIKPPRQPATTSDSDLFSAGQVATGQSSRSLSRSASPVPPSASPLTPTARHVNFPSKHQVALSQSAPREPSHVPKSELISRPAARPFSGDDATDAIALRAAISSLQFQRKKAEQDIKALQKIKGDALARPDDFQAHIIQVAKQQAQPPKDFDFSFKDDAEMVDDSEDEDKKPAAKAESGSSSFPPFPRPQDVVRCPPINWDKYHIVGEPLDRMHNVQQTRVGNPSNAGSNENVLSAPYDPMFDRLDSKQLKGGLGGAERRDSVSFSNQASDHRRMNTKP